MVAKIISLALAGALGTLARFGLSGLVQKFGGSSFPWGTAIVNLSGCLAAGLLWTLFENRWAVSGQTRTIVLIGFMGAFTTFSTLVVETGEMIRASQWLWAAGNIAIHNGLGLAALYVGISLGRAL